MATFLGHGRLAVYVGAYAITLLVLITMNHGFTSCDTACTRPHAVRQLESEEDQSERRTVKRVLFK